MQSLKQYILGEATIPLGRDKHYLPWNRSRFIIAINSHWNLGQSICKTNNLVKSKLIYYVVLGYYGQYLSDLPMLEKQTLLIFRLECPQNPSRNPRIAFSLLSPPLLLSSLLFSEKQKNRCSLLEMEGSKIPTSHAKVRPSLRERINLHSDQELPFFNGALSPLCLGKTLFRSAARVN